MGGAGWRQPASQEPIDLKNSMKIVLVHDRFPPDYSGGGEYVVLMIAKHLSDRGYQVKVVTAGDPALTNFEGVETHRLDCSSYAFNFKWKRITELCEDADIIQTFTYHGLYPACRAGRLLNIPVISMVMAQFGDAWLDMRGPLRGRLHRGFERFLLNLPVAHRIYLSDFSLELSKSICRDLSNASVIEPGVSLEMYRPAATKDYVMFSGKLEQRKGIGKVIAAASRLPQIPFRIMGWGDFEKLQSTGLPDNVELLPYIDRSDLAERMSHARIFVLPTRVETFGLAVAEAMASGCAIVSSSKLPFLGKHIDCDDVDQLVAAIGGLWEQENTCREMGIANHELAQQYNWNRHLGRLLDIYDLVSENSDAVFDTTAKS